MSETATLEKGLFETLESRSPEIQADHSKAYSHDHAMGSEHEDCTIEFLIQDMFLDHFFP